MADNFDFEACYYDEVCCYDEVKMHRAGHRSTNLHKKRCARQRTQEQRTARNKNENKEQRTESNKNKNKNKEQRTESNRPFAQYTAKKVNPHRAARRAMRTTLSQDLLASNSPAMADIVGLALAQERSPHSIRKFSFVHADSPRKIGIDLLEATTTDDSDFNIEACYYDQVCCYDEVKLHRAGHRSTNLHKKRCAFQRTRQQRAERNKNKNKEQSNKNKNKEQRTESNKNKHRAARRAMRTTLSQDLRASPAIIKEEEEEEDDELTLITIGIDLLEATTTDDSDSNSEFPDSEDSLAAGEASPQPPNPNLPKGSERNSAAVDGVSRMVATVAVVDYVAEAKGYLTVRRGDCVDVWWTSAESGDEGCRFSLYVFACHLGLWGWLPVEVVWEQYVDPRSGKPWLYDCATGNWQWGDRLAKEPKDPSKGAMEVDEVERAGQAAREVIRRQLRRWNGYNQVLRCQ